MQLICCVGVIGSLLTSVKIYVKVYLLLFIVLSRFFLSIFPLSLRSHLKFSMYLIQNFKIFLNFLYFTFEHRIICIGTVFYLYSSTIIYFFSDAEIYSPVEWEAYIIPIILASTLFKPLEVGFYLSPHAFFAQEFIQNSSSDSLLRSQSD